MIRVRLVATVHCEHPGCPRMDEHDERPSLSTDQASKAFARRARDAFEARGWFVSTDVTLCSDHYPNPRSHAK